MRGGEVNVSRGHHRRHVMCTDCPLARTEVSGEVLETNLRKVRSFTITEKAPTRALLKVAHIGLPMQRS